MTGDEIVTSLNEKFFVAGVTDDGFTNSTRVCWLDINGETFCCETFRNFRKRFPRKQLIDGRMQNVGSFWLKHKRRRQIDSPTLFRESEEKLHRKSLESSSK
jgi:hypothetical protein